MLTHEPALRYDPVYVIGSIAGAGRGVYTTTMRSDRIAIEIIALLAVVLTALFGAAAIFVALAGTLALAYFAFTTPPPPSLKPTVSSTPQARTPPG